MNQSLTSKGVNLSKVKKESNENRDESKGHISLARADPNTTHNKVDAHQRVDDYPQ